MKKYICLTCLCLNGFALSLEESLGEGDVNITKMQKTSTVSKQVLFQKPQEFQPQNTDLGSFASQSLAKVLNLSSKDKTEASLDYNALNVNIKNINTIADYDNASLLLEKQARIGQIEQAYSLGLINRYEIDDFYLGFNYFNDYYKEACSKNSFGAELQFSDYFKAYANYYDVKENDTDDSTELGVMFDLPYLSVININSNIKEAQNQYNITYSPLSILDLSLNYQDEKTSAKDQAAMWVKFRLNYEQSLSKQFYNSLYHKNAIGKFNRYDFATRTY
ncbi:inverse autotransporter beta domain-containing protein [Campylobacter sp. 2014D-0216]|uniref:inverse autotransporter beta domain-containing protein n=1 Tax=Campylobacter sp. 2014D-0216 TaxID=1813595 RepID=UPI0018A364E3|nr:inverse autotransporter beta domain-containing protein [Campylobacter sp. 2014D-0216]QOR01783.1 inverse autotransporter beta domain-containing protein [Campylobacter sp. 2014D-0216]